MTEISIRSLTIQKAHRHLVRGDFSARELAASYAAEIEKKNAELNIYIEVFDDLEAQVARACELIKEKRSEAPLLAGIPVAVKDNILIKGRRASAASKILEPYRAAYDATVIAKLKEQGAVFLGRTNMDEFAMGSSTENSAFGAVKNPHVPSRVPGGSSGGSAAAVAADCALAALGSDTGGSIRQPAGFCGTVGLKPTYGGVSRYGLIAMASSLDQIGPLSKTVEDARIIFQSLAGHDPKDSTSQDFRFQTSDFRHGKTIGVPYRLFEGGVDEDVLRHFNRSVEKLKKAGCEIREIELPHAKYALPAYYVIMPAEASSNLARFDGVRYGLLREGGDLAGDYKETRGAGFGEEVRRRIILGTYVLSAGYYDAYYTTARSMRMRVREDFEKAFETVCCIMTPTSPTPPFALGERANDPLSMYMADIFTVPASIAGIPAISVPSGRISRDGAKLPLGIQFMAPHGGEEVLFEAGKAFEEAEKS